MPGTAPTCQMPFLPERVRRIDVGLSLEQLGELYGEDHPITVASRAAAAAKPDTGQGCGVWKTLVERKREKS